MIKYKIFLIGFFILLISGIAFSASALLAPQIYITSLSIDKISYAPGEFIQGNIEIWNYESGLISDLFLNFEILGKQVDNVPTQVIAHQQGNNAFSVSGGEKEIKSFSYQLPDNLPTGNFTFRIELVNGRGEEMAWEDVLIEVGGDGKFVFLDDYWLVKDNQNLSPGGGVDYYANETPQVVFKIENQTDFSINAYPKIITYKRNLNDSPIKQTKGSDILLNPQSSQSVNLSLHSLANPDSYVTEIKLYDKTTQQEISNPIYFRWIIFSQDDAEILYANADKDNYQAGEEAQVDVQYTGPAHTFSETQDEYPIESGNLKVSLYDQNNQLVGEKTEKIDLTSGQLSVSVPINQLVDNPRVQVQVDKQGNLLDEYQFQTRPQKTEQDKKDESRLIFWENNKKYFLIGLILLVALLIIIMSLRKNKIKSIKVLIWLIIGFGLFIFAPQAWAAVEVTGGNCDTTILFNKPVPNQVYELGETINFKGKFRVTSCGDGLFFNKVTFYIAEDKEIPLKSVNACSNCLGASSTNYPSSACNCQWCSQVKVLNTPGYQVRKLGTVYPSDVNSGARPYWVEYNQSFVIPEDLEFSGPVRFYVQYSGTHWNNHWHWNITYQPGKIIANHDPEATDLNVFSPNYCVFGPIGNIFSWNFEDEDSQDQAAYQVLMRRLDDSKVYDSGKKIGSVSQITGQAINNEANYNFIDYDPSNQGYQWRVRVWDEQNGVSDWSNYNFFRTPKHRYPEPKFDWIPDQPAIHELVSFINQSKCYNNDNQLATCPINAWSWDINNGTYLEETNSSSKNPKFRFNTTGQMQVSLTVADQDNYTCAYNNFIDVGLKIPEWKELLP